MGRSRRTSGGIRELLPIAVPIFFSQATDVIIVFTDRFFLAELGKEALAASLSGALITFLATVLLTGTLGQITPLTAQFLGSKRLREAAVTAEQGLLLTLLAGPVFSLAGILLAPQLFSLFSDNEKLIRMETEYFRILVLTVNLAGIRQSYANFFAGIGKSRIISTAAAAGVIFNIPLAWIFIFGKFGLPALGLPGAALAGIIASTLPIVILAGLYYSRKLHEIYGTRQWPRWRRFVMEKLIRYGFPTGAEGFINVTAFTLFSLILQSYSADVGAAVTIVLNWDMVSFLPVMGLGQATSSLVGRYLGAKKKKLALRSAWSGLKMAWCWGAMVTILYFSFSATLVGIFSSATESYSVVHEISALFLKVSCLYIVFDSTYILLSGVLKGAGDTVWTLKVSTTAMWLMTITIGLGKKYLGMTPLQAWCGLVTLVIVLAVSYGMRFRRGKWLHMSMIEDNP